MTFKSNVFVDGNSYVLCNESNKFANIYATKFTGDLDGHIPMPSNYNTIPVGAIAMIAVYSASSWPAAGAIYPGKILVGDTIYASGGTLHNNAYNALYASQLYINSDNTISLYEYNTNNQISIGTFKAMTMCTNNKSGNEYLYCLAMRVE